MSGLEHPSDKQRAEAIQAAVSAACDSRKAGSLCYYEDIAEHWLALEIAVALDAAIGALGHAGFCVSRPDQLRKAALETARSDFWRRHIIIDSLDMDVRAAALAGIEATLQDYRPLTKAEHQAALEAKTERPAEPAAC